MAMVGPMMGTSLAFFAPVDDDSAGSVLSFSLAGTRTVSTAEVHHLANDHEQDGIRRRDFLSEITRVAGLLPGWDGARAICPDIELLRSAARLGFRVLEDCRPRPHTLNLRAAPDGTLSMLLFGFEGREAELLIEEAGAFTAIWRKGGGDFEETPLANDDFGRVASWLRGDSDHV